LITQNISRRQSSRPHYVAGHCRGGEVVRQSPVDHEKDYARSSAASPSIWAGFARRKELTTDQRIVAYTKEGNDPASKPCSSNSALPVDVVLARFAPANLQGLWNQTTVRPGNRTITTTSTWR